MRNFDFFGILPFTLVFALSFAIWTFWEKMETFEKKMETFEKKWKLLRKKWKLLRNIPGPKNYGRALCEKPYRSRRPLRAPEQRKNEKILSQFWAWFSFAHTSVTGQQIIDIKIKCNVIVSPVMLQVAHRKCRKRALQFHWTCHQITPSVCSCSPLPHPCVCTSMIKIQLPIA